MSKILKLFLAGLAVVLASVFLFSRNFSPPKSLNLEREVSKNREAPIQEKVLICGVCRNIQEAVPNTIKSIEKLGSQFLEYRTIIYENNSTDSTKALLKSWADSDPHVIYMSEQLSKRKLSRELSMKTPNRTEKIARARNKVLEVALSPHFDDFKYVIWADLDFLTPWDVDSIKETILHPQEAWDAVLSYGFYDLFAMRSSDCPIGFELIGDLYWKHLDALYERFTLDRNDPWKKVYSAFGGLGIYKREAIRGCRYSGVVTPDLEKVTFITLEKARRDHETFLLDEYENLLSSAKILQLSKDCLRDRDKYPEVLGIKLPKGKITWFSCTPKSTLPWTCEHIPFHASMILHGFDKIFVNPKIQSGDISKL